MCHKGPSIQSTIQSIIQPFLVLVYRFQFNRITVEYKQAVIFPMRLIVSLHVINLKKNVIKI